MTGFYGYFLAGNKSSASSMKKAHKTLDIVSPTWLEIKSDGGILKKYNKEEMELLNKLMGKDRIIPVVQNYRMKAEVINKVLEQENIWNNIIEGLENFLKDYGYRGINLDLEGVRIENKNKFTNFVGKIYNRFTQNNLQLDLSLPAKTEKFNNSIWAGAYKYKDLAKLADNIVIMAYDFHWSGGPPGPIAPLFWVQDVVDYVIMNIPINKVFLGIAFYGYDWTVSKERELARGLSHIQIKNIASKYNSRIEWDQDSQTPYLKYTEMGENHEVWFENKQSIKKKIQLIHDFQLAGAAFWRLGLEEEDLWDILQKDS